MAEAASEVPTIVAPKDACHRPQDASQHLRLHIEECDDVHSVALVVVLNRGASSESDEKG